MQCAIAGRVRLANLVLNLDRGRGAWEGFLQQLDEAIDVLGVVADYSPANEIAANRKSLTRLPAILRCFSSKACEFVDANVAELGPHKCLIFDFGDDGT